MHEPTYYVAPSAGDKGTFLAITYHPSTVVRRVLGDVVGCHDPIALLRERFPDRKWKLADRDTGRWANAIWRSRQAPDLGWAGPLRTL